MPLFGRDAIRLGAAAATVTIAVVALVVAVDGMDSFTDVGDSYSYRLVASDPFGDGPASADDLSTGETAYRYGRVLLPLGAWVLAAGRPGLAPYVLPFMGAAAIGLVVACAAALVERRGVSARRGLAVLLVPGLWLPLTAAYADPLVIGLVLLGYLLVVADRRGWAWVPLALATLGREVAAVALVPLVIADTRARRWRDVARWLSAPVLLVGWNLWVRWRVGELPLLADTVNRREALALPGGGFARAWEREADVALLLAAAWVVVTAVGGVWAWRRGWHPLGGGAATFGLVALCLGPLPLTYLSDTLRLSAPGNVLVALVAAARVQVVGRPRPPRRVAPS